MKNHRNHFIGIVVGVIASTLLFHSGFLFADSSNIDKVEHPYVQNQEKEISLSSFYQGDDDPKRDNTLKYKLSVGRFLSDQWFAEIAIAGRKNNDSSIEVSSYEIEAKWQITEQGEYSADYGLLLEYSNEQKIDVEEVSVTLLTEKQWGEWVGTANLSGIYEWGDDITDEFETALALQMKYRYKATLEPAIELYSGENDKGLGPVLTGTKRFSLGKKLKWEMGVIFGVDEGSADQTYRALLEYEFQ